LRRARADVVSATDPQARFSKPSFGEMERGRLRRARGRRRGRAHHESHRCAGWIAVVLDARLRLSPRPQANPMQRYASPPWPHSRRVGGGNNHASAPPAESLPVPKNFFCKSVFHTKAAPLWDGTISGQVFGRGGMTKFSKWKVPPTAGSGAP